MQKNTRKVKFSGAAHEKRTAAQFSVQQPFCVSGKTGAQPSEAKNSLVSLTTVPESSSNAMRLGPRGNGFIASFFVLKWTKKMLWGGHIIIFIK